MPHNIREGRAAARLIDSIASNLRDINAKIAEIAVAQSERRPTTDSLKDATRALGNEAGRLRIAARLIDDLASELTSATRSNPLTGAQIRDTSAVLATASSDAAAVAATLAQLVEQLRAAAVELSATLAAFPHDAGVEPSEPG